jgi:hypothetical protein
MRDSIFSYWERLKKVCELWPVEPFAKFVDAQILANAF